MKKLLALILAMLMIVGVLASCGGGNKDNDDLPDDDKEQNEENEQGGTGDNGNAKPECNHRGGTATCTKKAICILCNEEYGDFKHQYVTVGEIKDCGGNTVFEAEICIECGYTESLLDGEIVVHPHSFVRREPVEPTCTEEGCSVWFECENCGYDVKKNVDELGHLWGNYKYYDELYHTCECVRTQCDADDKTQHRINSWAVISEPTCIKDGSMGGYCVDCGHWCTIVLIASHRYDNGKNTKEPTCTEEGIKLYTCIVCGDEKTEAIDSLGHDFSDYVLTNSNPENPCEHVAECSRCDAEKYETIHDYGEWILTNDPDDPCEHVKNCSRCNTKEYETIHDFGPWTLTNNPDDLCEYIKQCSRCKVVEYDTIHDFDDGTVTKEPNCIEDGNKLYVCKRCKLEENEILDAYGHDYEIFKHLDPTCTENGYTIYRCKRCDDLKAVFYKALGHDVIYEYNDDCHWRKCTRCKNVLSSEEMHKLEVNFKKKESENETVYSLYYFCDTCEYKRIIKEGVAHVHNEAEIIDVVAPTCTESGHLPGLKCATEGCNEIFIQPEAVEALGHKFIDRVCLRCGEIDYSVGLAFTSNGDNTCYVSRRGACTDTYIIIPSTSPNGDRVTAIGEKAFYNDNGLARLIIPDSVTRIGSDAFMGCNKLTSVTIGNGVTSIGDDAFYYCDSLTSIIIPDSVTSIGNYAFRYCSSLTSVTIGNSVKYISYSLFLDCNSLTSITVDKNNTVYKSIDGNLYMKDGKTLKLYAIGKTATNFTIPDGVTSIDSYAFSGCDSLTSIIIPDSVTSIGSYAFRDCSSLMSVKIPDSVTSIGGSTFSGCSSLTSITIPDSVTSIGSYAFYNCSSLTSVTILDSVTSIGDRALFGTGYYNNESNWENGVLYIGKYLINAKDNISGAYTIKSGTKLIADDAFSYCDNLTSVTIPNSVTSISYRAFYGCSSLTSVTIPDSVTSISDSAFYNCSSLTSVTIPDSVTSISDSAFYNCSSLTSIIVDKNNAVYKSIDGNLYMKDGKTLKLYAIGKTATSFTIPDSVTSIGSSAFSGCESLTSIIIPDSVTSIGSSTFSRCDSLTSITIPNSITSIDDGAFHNCYKLVEVINKSDLDITKGSSNNGHIAYYALEVHNGGSKIVNKDGYLFYKADGINYLVDYTGIDSNITLPTNYNGENYVINGHAFYNNDNLMSVTIPSKVTSIGDGAFASCNKLTSVTIPNSVTSIGYGAFAYCDKLTSVTIPDSVTSIDSSAFLNCTSLTSVEFKNTEGWKAGSRAISSTVLKDKRKAATYLNSTYLFYTWTCS